MGTPDIAEKLLAAITAKEDKAREATEGPWTLYDRGVGWEINELPDVHDGTTFTKPDAEFIVDNDPDDVLRHCAADRKTLARHTKTACRGLHGDTPHQPECFDCWRDGDEWPCADLRDLADGYGVTP